MQQREAASIAMIENGTEEGLGDSSDPAPISFPQDILMEEHQDPPRNNPPAIGRRYQDQMVPTISSSLFRIDEEESSVAPQDSAGDSRAVVPTNVIVNQDLRRDELNDGAPETSHSNNTLPQFNFVRGRGGAEDSTAESSATSSSRGRDGGVVPVWSPPSPSYSEQFMNEENGPSSYLQTHQQSHQIINWKRLSQTG